MKKYSIGFIGCGNMAQAIIGALLDNWTRDVFKNIGYKIEISCSDSDENKLKKMDERVHAYSNNQLMIEKNDLIVLAIKPQTAKDCLVTLDFTGKVVLSIMAGVKIEKLKVLLQGKTDKIIRVMPNLNAKIKSSYNAYCAEHISHEEEEIAKVLLNSFGDAHYVDEGMMDSVTGVTGSGPAFVFKFIKAFRDAAMQRGFDKSVATQMALYTIIGSAYQIDNDPDIDIDRLIDSVCSKGGTTIEGVNYLNECKMEENVIEAINRSIKRSEELSKGI